MSSARIHDSLTRLFQRHRLIFWYDATGEWKETFTAYPDETVAKLTVANDEFRTKVRVVRDPDPDARYLIYVPTSSPADADNWMLDLLLQGYEYKADRASLALQEVGLPNEFAHIAEEHADYFFDDKRKQALKEMVGPDDQERAVRLKMMAILAEAPVEIDGILLQFLGQGTESDGMDPVSSCFAPAALTEYFWNEVERLFGYASPSPTLRDFAVGLFRGANPLDHQVTLHPHAKVFLQRWKDSQSHSISFRQWSHQMERELQIAAALDQAGDKVRLADCDTFEIFEKFTLHGLCESFAQDAAAVDLRTATQWRRTSFWHSLHSDGYAALEYALELRELLAGADLSVDSLANGFHRYVTTWWQIDLAYRRCHWHLRRYGQVQVMERISKWVERTYVNNFLLPLADRWSDQVRKAETWNCPGVPSQRQFYERHVQPFVAKGQKVFIIVSDALRYEAAAEFAQQLISANRWTADVEAMFGVLPSYTQLGMAALLPGKELAIDPTTATVTVDGRSAIGTTNRSTILSLACGGKGVVVQAEDFLEMNTKTEGRTLMRDHEVIAIFHNVIDKTGDASGTEAKTFDAVQNAFDELQQIIKKIANINGSNMLLTADHGFIFQQDDLHEQDGTPLPDSIEWTFRNRRFALGRGISPNPAVKVFESQALGVSGDWSAAFPLSLGRFPLQGSGKRYVHGGVSLQEIVIPVVKIHKSRVDDTGRVEIEILRVPAKITTGQLSVELFQTRPAVGKSLARTLRVGVFAKDGTLLSEIKTEVFDSSETEGRLRQRTVLLTLSRVADDFNNTEVDLRLEETVPGTSQIVTYGVQSVRLQKSFTTDFDD